MRTKDYTIYKITFTISLTLIIMCLMVLPMMSKNSPEYVITIISLIINSPLCVFIIIKLLVLAKKKKKS